ncbi:MAG TPA: hypothetical protein PK409_08490, partial [Thermosynergistes sp.]|nr:hypothetical protein [Thermosynergistes sp.]
MAMVREAEVMVDDELSIVARRDPRELQTTLQKIGAFQELVRTQLREGKDYGAIPGAGDRKVLLKPGAEKITVLLGLRSKFEVAGKVEDFESGFFAYMVRCSLVAPNGETITEGLGQANTKERRYVRQDPYTLANTVLKMARKRALVDAALTVGSLSDLFTQDIEDAIDAEAIVPPGAFEPMRSQGEETLATDNQRKAIFAVSRKAGMTDEELKALVVERYGKAST